MIVVVSIWPLSFFANNLSITRDRRDHRQTRDRNYLRSLAITEDFWRSFRSLTIANNHWRSLTITEITYDRWRLWTITNDQWRSLTITHDQFQRLTIADDHSRWLMITADRWRSRTMDGDHWRSLTITMAKKNQSLTYRLSHLAYLLFSCFHRDTKTRSRLSQWRATQILCQCSSVCCRPSVYPSCTLTVDQTDLSKKKSQTCYTNEKTGHSSKRMLNNGVLPTISGNTEESLCEVKIKI